MPVNRSLAALKVPVRRSACETDSTPVQPSPEGECRLEARSYARVVTKGQGPARIGDVHEFALGMPHVMVQHGPSDNPVYQVGGKSFVFFRNPRPDAVDLETGERYADVIVFWVPSESDKQALVQDRASPFFTTAHFDGHPSVLLRASRISGLLRQELAELVEDAWLTQASPTRRAVWLRDHNVS